MKYINLKIPEHSYFFGFAQTDGTLGRAKNFKNKGRFQIEVGEKDIHILRFFKRLFPSIHCGINARNRDTNFKENYKSFSFTICNMGFRKELDQLGIPYGKKSLVISPPRTKFCERDYIRGLIDGDGSVGTSRRGYPFISVSVKSEALKNYFCKVIKETTGEKKRLMRNKRDDTYNVMVNREKAQQIIRYLYYPDCLALKRKLKSAQRALKWKRPATLKSIFSNFWEPWEDKYILNHALEESCTHLKRTERSINMRFWRLNNHKARYLGACLNKTKTL